MDRSSSSGWLPAMALALVAGVALADALGGAREAAWAASLVALFAGARPHVSAHWRGVCAVAACAATGASLLSAELERSARGAPPESIDVVVDARVCGREAVPNDWTRVDLCDAVRADATGPAGPAVPERVRAVPARTRVVPQRVRVVGNGEDGTAAALARLPLAARVRMALRLSPIHSAVNPGVAVSERSLARAGIGARGRLAHPLLVVELGERAVPHGIVQNARDRWLAGLSLRGEPGLLLAALGLGAKSAVSDATRDAFVTLGVAHLLAVSGLHLAWLAGAAFLAASFCVRGVLRGSSRARAIARRGGEPRRLCFCVAWCVATAYADLTGWAAPVQRAWVLLTALCLGLLAKRPRRAGVALAAAALALGVAEPGALFHAGTQLSFAACAGLLAAVPLAIDAEESSRRWRGASLKAKELLGASATAAACTAPVLAAHGMAVSPWGLAVNALAIPWTGLLLLPAALGSVACQAFDWPRGLDVSTAIAQVSIFAVRTAAGWLDGEAVPGSARPEVWVLVGVSGLAWAAVRSRSLMTRVALSLGAVLCCGAAPPSARAPGLPRLVSFDVGLGDATLIQMDGVSLLIDGGAALPGGLDWGRRVLVPALRALGVARLDVVVATHADLDHRGGLPSVLGSFPVGELWLPAGAMSEPGFDALRSLAAARGTVLRLPARGDPAWWRAGVRVETLWPERGHPDRDRNEASLVLRLTTEDGIRVLLTGDAGIPSEVALLSQDALRASRLPSRVPMSSLLSADVLKVGHHGSAGSSSAPFLHAVGASVAVLSAPCGRRALPHPAATQRLREAGASVWWTGRDGAVSISLARPLVVFGERRSPRRCTPR